MSDRSSSPVRDARAPVPSTHLFNVRLWSEDMGGKSAMRGEVRHVLSGAICYFQDWSTLLGYLKEKMQELEQRVEGGEPASED